MTTLNESSRRAFLTAIAASGAAAAVVAAPGTVHAAGEPGGLTAPGTPADPSTALRTEAFPTPTSGTQYKLVLGADFDPLDENNAYTKNFGQVVDDAGNGTYYYALNELPNGARITEVTFAVLKSATYPNSMLVNAFRMIGGTSVPLIATASTALLPVQPAEQYVSLVVDPTNAMWVIDNQLEATIYLVLNMNSVSRMNSVRIGYVPGPTTPLGFVPISPKRAYDSRFVAPLGPLPNNTNRVISVANSYVTGSGTLETSNIIPATARAIAYNLTVANTVGQGFLSVNPGDAVAPGGSSINWFASGQLLANGLVVNLDNNRQVNVFGGGGGTTDFIIDILGYYV